MRKIHQNQRHSDTGFTPTPNGDMRICKTNSPAPSPKGLGEIPIMVWGFTLPELLVTISLLVIIIGAIYSAYLLGQKAFREGEISAEILQNGRVILERTSREIRQAGEIATELSEEESGAVSSILFEDGHIEEPYHYIHYFKEDNLVKRRVVGYYFSGDPEQDLVPWNSTPPEGQTLETKIIKESQIVGEYVADLKFWNPKLINIVLTLEKQNKTLQLKTKVFGRNL